MAAQKWRKSPQSLKMRHWAFPIHILFVLLTQPFWRVMFLICAEFQVLCIPTRRVCTCLFDNDWKCICAQSWKNLWPNALCCSDLHISECKFASLSLSSLVKTETKLAVSYEMVDLWPHRYLAFPKCLCIL